MTASQRLQAQLTALRRKGRLPPLAPTLEQATQKHLDVVPTLNLLADIAWEQRWQNARRLRGRPSALKDKLTIDHCNFDHPPSSPAQKTRRLKLLTLACVAAPRDVRLIGPPGTGPPFVATCRASAACNAKIKGLFPTAIDRLNQRMAAEADHSLWQQLHHD